MGNEQQSPLMQWFDDNRGPEVNTKAKEAVNLLSSLVVGVAFTGGVIHEAEDLHANYIKLVKMAFSGLYDSGDAENHNEDLVSSVYTHLTGENFEDLQDEWATDMEMAMAQNRALLGYAV